MSIPIHVKDDDAGNDFEMINGVQPEIGKDFPKRATSIVELEEKLQKIKSQNNFHLKSKLAKKSINSKLNKKLKKKERSNKTKVKGPLDFQSNTKQEKIDKVNANISKPIFNNEGKLVFSKFDFANFGKKDKGAKVHKDPKKILEDMKQQENKFRQLEENDSVEKVKEIKEKIAWKNILQKAEGQKVKDDPILLKKSIKRMEQKKKVSKQQWENRIKNVEQKKEERQKKRKENISKKKKEKKTKIVKTAMKRGRVVI
ncbi:unnamed protein product [Parnassius apollo]|uniref:(apollo) hypothetical protein n=1 Tax=Parnassius apollo TaxID=110799 RepID=A0A8S3XV30_PARAO|nr:unnamed protein product [Parnassius apollo]